MKDQSRRSDSQVRTYDNVSIDLSSLSLGFTQRKHNANVTQTHKTQRNPIDDIIFALGLKLGSISLYLTTIEYIYSFTLT
jgi:hypothetical protein